MIGVIYIYIYIYRFCIRFCIQTALANLIQVKYMWIIRWYWDTSSAQISYFQYSESKIGMTQNIIADEKCWCVCGLKTPIIRGLDGKLLSCVSSINTPSRELTIPTVGITVSTMLGGISQKKFQYYLQWKIAYDYFYMKKDFFLSNHYEIPLANHS